MWIARTGILASSGGSMDADALAFITAATITDSTQKSAVNQLVKDLKTANVWAKMKAVYPFVGGTAASHRFNLKAPTTNNSDFYLDFIGGVTHSSTGVKFNGSTGYADTKLIPFNDLTSDNTHHSVYSRSAWSVSAIMGGCNDSNFPNRYVFMSNPNATTLNNIIYNNTSNIFSATIVNTQGLMMGNRTAIDNVNVWKNGVKVLGDTLNGLTDRPIIKYYIGARNNELTASDFDNKEYAFYTIGNGLSDAEALAFYNAVNSFQVALSRNV